MPVGRAVLHFDERIVGIAVGQLIVMNVGRIIGAHGDECHAFIVIVVVKLVDAAFVEA